MASLTTVAVSTRIPSDLKQALLRLAARRGIGISELLAQLAAAAARGDGKGLAAMLDSEETLAALEKRLEEAERLLEAERRAHEDAVRVVIELMDRRTGLVNDAKYRKKTFADWESGAFAPKPNPDKWK